MTDFEKFSQCPCTGKTLAKIVQPAVLAVLAEHPLHGYLVVQRLGEMMMFRGEYPDPAGVYRVLKSMDRRGLVTSSWDLGTAGPAKRRFTLTDLGPGSYFVEPQVDVLPDKVVLENINPPTIEVIITGTVIPTETPPVITPTPTPTPTPEP